MGGSFDALHKRGSKERPSDSSLVKFYTNKNQTLVKDESGRIDAPKWKKGEVVTRDLLPDFLAKVFMLSSGNFSKFKKLLEEHIDARLVDEDVLLVAADMLTHDEMSYLLQCFHDFHKEISTKTKPEPREVTLSESSLRNLIRGENARAIGVMDWRGLFRNKDTLNKLQKLLKELGVSKENLPKEIIIGSLNNY